MKVNGIVLLLLLLNYGCNKPTALENRFLGDWQIIESVNMDHTIKDIINSTLILTKWVFLVTT
ncbi:hypothetical protein SAMN05216480_12216 [Pustulibacterium marinum]|uniref:Uncharacterized protein n=1 Tax=Pustulibacterium marinum TaxID=1224947 RepID=A0A1I7IUK4_9FLAO|nr:hypothetical protein SAMN05216480_12216 [Pustulibacterium marinum]